MCPFCDIVSGKIKANILYEDDVCMAVMDIYPLADGHTLIVPKKHYENLLEIKDEDLKSIITMSKNVSKALNEALGSEGINIISNNGKAADQTISHATVHIVPRWKQDNIKMPSSRNSQFASMADPDDLVELAKKIKAKLKNIKM